MIFCFKAVWYCIYPSTLTVKMPTIAINLTIMNMINIILAKLSMEKLL